MLTNQSDRDAVFKALADPTRRRIVSVLAGRPAAVHALTARFEMSRPAVSQHLAVLREAGIVEARPKGRENVYYLRTAALRDVEDWLNAIWAERLVGLKELVEGEDT